MSISGDWSPIGTFDYCAMTVDVYEEFSVKWKGRGVWGMIARLEEVRVMGEDLSDEDVPF